MEYRHLLERKHRSVFDSQDGLSSIAPSTKRARVDVESISGFKAPILDKSLDIDLWQEYIREWAADGHWPRSYFERDSQPIIERSLLQRDVEYDLSNSNLSHSESHSTQSAKYARPDFPQLMRYEGSCMYEDKEGLSREGITFCKQLFERYQPVPSGTIFDDDVFDIACKKRMFANEARVFKDITALVVPGIENHATMSKGTLYDMARECVKLRWDECMPVAELRPVPNYAACLDSKMFEEKTHSTSGRNWTPSLHSGIAAGLCFPFLTCEVKRAQVGLAVANNQNQCSMVVACRAIVELYRATDRVCKTNSLHGLHRQVLAFSVSHNERNVAIFAHYAVITTVENRTTYRARELASFNISSWDGRDKWTTYKFIKNLYEVFLPIHFARIESAIDAQCACPIFCWPLTIAEYRQRSECSSDGSLSFGTPSDTTVRISVSDQETISWGAEVENPLAGSLMYKSRKKVQRDREA